MANFEFKLPDIGEGVAEGEIVDWHVAVGDVVAEDDPMVEVMTDKATVTIGAPRAGTIAELRFGVGEVAQVGQVIVSIAQSGNGASASNGTAQPEKPAEKPKASTTKSEGAATAVGDIREGLPGTSYFSSPSKPATSAGATPAPKAAAPSSYYSEKPLATPATRKLARDLGVDLRTVQPTGPGGRTTRDDVKAAQGGAGASAATSSVKAQPAEAVAARRTLVGQDAAAGPLEERKPFVGIRRKIAQRMQHTKNTAAHFTFVEECDVTKLIEMRARMNEAARDRGVKLSYLPFIVKAVVAALKKHPVLNSALDETTNELVYRRYYDIGIAAATPVGLMVPVVTDADKRSLVELAVEIQRLGDGAREGKLGPDELSGSTFTITSLGKQGGLFATPVLNHPEVGILGVHQMKQKPVVRDGQIAVGDVMLLSLSFDHRIVDGHVGAAFAYDIIDALENPESLFLDMA